MDSTTPTPTAPAPQVSKYSRFLAAWWGAFIADALAMPAHWYYKRELINRDYGPINGYCTPTNPHPDSTLWRCSYESSCEKDEILHDQAQYWGRPGIHYHQFLQAGENTLNVKIAALLAESLIENNGYNQEEFVRRYVNFMLNPESHCDTYVEECHRFFFKNYGLGKPIEKCGGEDTHIGCLATLTPLILFYHNDHTQLLQQVRKHLCLTHKGETAARAGELFAETIYHTLKGESLEQTIFESIGRNRYQALTFPFRRWIENHTDEEVVGKLLSNASCLEDALPATYYLALKYANDLEQGLIRNTHLGGDNCHRGIPLGTILGAIGGCEAIPGEWVGGLVDQANYDSLGDALWNAAEGL